MKNATVTKLLQFTLLSAALSFRVASADTVNLGYLALAAYALLGRPQAVQALTLSWLFTMLSPGIAPEITAASIGRYAVIAGAATSVLFRCGRGEQAFSLSRPVLATLALGSFLIVHSLLFSSLSDVSILKAVSWTVVMATLLSAWSGLDYQARAKLERQLFGGLVLLVLVSLPLVFTRMGYLRNDTGFQGVLNHPQAFGPAVASLGGWLGGRALATRRAWWRDIALLSLCLVLLVISESRTAALALVLGLASAVLVSPFIARLPTQRLMPGLTSRKLQALAVLASIALLFTGPALLDRANDFLLKGGDSTSIVEAADLSRGPLVYTMLANFEEKPLAGIGFGLASDPSSMQLDRDAVFGLPISASIEKGVLPIAVLEELGIFGFLIVVAWLWMIFRRGTWSGITATAVLFTLLLTNLGESTLFSPGGMGLLLLVLLAWAATGRHRGVQIRIRG